METKLSSSALMWIFFLPVIVVSYASGVCRTGSTILTGICFPPLVLKLIQGNGLSGSVVRVSKLENIWRFFSTNAILRFSLEHTKLSRSLEDSFGISITNGWFSWVEIAHLVSDSEAALPSPLVSNNLGRTSEDENSEFPQSCLNLLHVESSVLALLTPDTLSFSA